MIHPPYRSIHRVMFLVTGAHGAAAAVLAVSYAANSGWGSADFTLGVVITAILIGVSLAADWLAYLSHQRTVTVTRSQLRAEPWLRIGPFGRAVTVATNEIMNVQLLRPHHITIETRSQRSYRIGTFWWRRREYAELEAALRAFGIPTEYSETWSYGRLLAE